jgi:DNA topoisomerase-1
MRTDSVNLSETAIQDISKQITDSYGKPYLQVRKYKNKNESAQEAHEAIRPTYMDKTKVDNADAQKLYDLIWKRTLESCMPSAQYNTISEKITAPLETEFVYRTEQPIFLGWQIIDQTKKDDDTNTSNYQYIQTLKQNVSMKPKKIDSKFTLVELKSHYTEARLVQLLEEKGIGRPSTFASLVDKIQERKYVEKQNVTGKELECVDFALKDGEISEVVSKKEF